MSVSRYFYHSLQWITQLKGVFFLSVPRFRILTRRCKSNFAKKIGRPEFEIPKNVLDLIYAETLCW